MKEIPVIGFAGYSNSGKTTLAAEIVRNLELEGLRVAVVKHDGHGHYKEAAGTDSSSYRTAGASSVVVVSPDCIVTYERKSARALEDVLEGLSNHSEPYDLIIVEGFKSAPIPKIAVIRRAEDIDILALAGPNLIAIASTQEIDIDRERIPVFDLDQPDAVVRFIHHYLDEFYKGETGIT